MEAILDGLHLNATIAVQIFNFIVMLIFIRLVVYKPVVNILNKRQQAINEDIEAAERGRKEAEDLRQGYLAEMQKTKEEAQAIIQQATKSAEVQAQQILAAAQEEAGRIKESSLADIEREKEKAVAELREQVVSLSMLVANKVVGRQMTDELQHDMVQEFIKEAGELPC